MILLNDKTSDRMKSQKKNSWKTNTWHYTYKRQTLIQTSERQTRDIILLKDKHFIKDKALKKLPKDKHKLVKDKHVNWYFKRQTSKRPTLERQPRERYFKRTNYWETNSWKKTLERQTPERHTSKQKAFI